MSNSIGHSASWYEPEPDPPSVLCGGCDGEIYEGETAYWFNGKLYHAECLREEISNLPDDEFAELVGAEKRRNEWEYQF